MQCPSCSHDCREGAAFCDQCGARIDRSCEACGNELRTSARFCDACGHPAGAPAQDPRTHTPPHLAERILRDRGAIEGERRNVTVLFIDAIGSVSTTERMDSERHHALVHAGTQRMMEAVHRFEGTVTQFRGDGLMAVFGAPIAHEDSARRALSAALVMRNSLAAHGRDVEGGGERSFHYRIGVNTGPVIVGRIGDDLTMDYTAIGDTVNLAARMEGWAAPSTIYVTETTRRAAADHFEFRDLGDLEVKGKAEAVHAHELLRELPARTRLAAAASRGLTPYVGRDDELAQLHAYFERARAGTGQVVLVSGEAGIGKSRLLHEYRRSLDGVRWIEGHCISYGQNIAYLPVTDMLKSTFGVRETDDDAAIIARIDETIADWDEGARSTAPYLKFMLSLDPGDASFADMNAVQRRAGILDGLRALLAQESRRGPFVAVVEDLHWIDGQSEEAIAALVDLVASAPAMLVLTFRTGYAHKLGDRSYYNRLALRQLVGDASEMMAQNVLGTSELPGEVRRLITAKAEGNPFFVEEVARSLVESGVLRSTDGTFVLTRSIEEIRIPDTIQEVILSRIDRLAQDGKSAIQLASVIGREFTARLLERISDVETHLDGVLGELKALELIYEKAYFPELAYMFKHALTHEVALSTLLSSKRRALHCVVAAAVEELYADRLQEQYEMLAHHYYAGEDWPKALDFLVKAAEKSATAYANAEAVRFYALAIEVCERLGDRLTAYNLAYKQAFINWYVGEVAAAVSSAATMVRCAEELSDRRRYGHALIYRGAFETWLHSFDVAEATLREAITVGAEEGFDDVEWAASFWLFALFIITGRLDEVHELEPMMRSVPPSVEDEYHRGWWAVFRSGQLHWRGRFDEALAWMDEHAVDHDPVDDVLLWINQEVERAWPLMAKGEYDQALRIQQETLAVCERVGEMPYRGRILNSLGWLFGELQDPERAILWNQRSIDAAIEMNAPDPEIENNARLNLADSFIALGRLDEAEEHLLAVERTVRDPRPEDHWALWLYSQHHFHSYGEYWLRRGDARRALAYADECIELASWSDRQKNVVKGRRLRGQALLALGDLAGAEAELLQALEIAEQVTNPRQLWETHAAIGDLRSAQERRDAAEAEYRRALDVIDRVASSLSDESMRETFVSSHYVTALRDKARAPTAS